MILTWFDELGLCQGIGHAAMCHAWVACMFLYIFTYFVIPCSKKRWQILIVLHWTVLQ